MKLEYCLFQNNHDALFAKLKQCNPTQRYKVEVRLWKSQRSLQQNKWIRAYAKDLGKHLGYMPDEMYDILMYKFVPVFRIVDGKEVRMAGHFSNLKTDEAAEVQSAIERWASELGFFWDGGYV